MLATTLAAADGNIVTMEVVDTVKFAWSSGRRDKAFYVFVQNLYGMDLLGPTAVTLITYIKNKRSAKRQ